MRIFKVIFLNMRTYFESVVCFYFESWRHDPHDLVKVWLTWVLSGEWGWEGSAEASRTITIFCERFSCFLMKAELMFTETQTSWSVRWQGDSFLQCCAGRWASAARSPGCEGTLGSAGGCTVGKKVLLRCCCSPSCVLYLRDTNTFTHSCNTLSFQLAEFTLSIPFCNHHDTSLTH